MILIADGGSTKVDWIALNKTNQEIFRVRSLGLNPAVVHQQELLDRVTNINQLIDIKEDVTEIYFYGAGCGTKDASLMLKEVFQAVFTKANIHIAEDLLAAVYAATGYNPAIVCILGTGSNACFFDGKNVHIASPSLGYLLMDEASGNFFGKKLLRDYYNQIMPKNIANNFDQEFNLEIDFVKNNLYKQPNPNTYLATFAKFLFTYKEEEYIKTIIKEGFQQFFKYRILPFQKDAKTPLYFIGSIAFYFRELLEKTAKNNGLVITDVIQRPIDKLIEFHKLHINQ